MRFLCAFALLLLLTACLPTCDARADVVVLANYSSQTVELSIVPSRVQSQNFRIEAGDSLVVPTLGSTSVTFRSQGTCNWPIAAENNNSHRITPVLI